MACLCVHVEFVPSIFSSQLTARCAALSIVSGIIQQGACAHAVDTGNTTASPWPVDILSAHLLSRGQHISRTRKQPMQHFSGPA